jgi:hypothetical protein
MPDFGKGMGQAEREGIQKHDQQVRVEQRLLIMLF